MAGTFFESSGENGNMLITDPRIHLLQDVENVWYRYFSRRYPIPYMDVNTNVFKETPFWEENGQVYERYHIDGFIGATYFFDHITQKQTMKYGLRTILKTLTEILMTLKNSGHLCMRTDS